jgi:NAD(P)H-hydrate epimerase
MPARVATADETRACERETMERGTSSAELMRRAGRAAALVIAERFSEMLAKGTLVFAGPGNNGGDAWVVAEFLTSGGHDVAVVEVAPPKSAESKEAKDRTLNTGRVRLAAEPNDEGLIIDGLLGTGATGAPRGDIGRAIDAINAMRASDARIVSLDLPSGLDATTGDCEKCVRADATVTFGVLKRGHLISREVCGEITTVDIGLNDSATMQSLPTLVDSHFAHSLIPPVPVSANKGTRKRLAVVGGGKGMAGAVILSGEGALRSGVGLLRIICHESSTVSVHAGIPAALVSAWPQTAGDLAVLVDAEDCIAIGPGLGNTGETRDLVERILLSFNGPVVLDADALNVFARDTPSLARLLNGRDAVLTPHPAELGRLLGVPTSEVVARRFEIGVDLARETGAALVVKGAPTIVFGSDGRRMVIASGTAALATGGSGDVLTGMVATLLGQMPASSDRAMNAAACAAFIHGRAAELRKYVRGVTLADILDELPRAWNETPQPIAEGTLARLEARA